MTDEKKAPLSLAMVGALRAVRRMKGDAEPAAALWAEFLDAVRDTDLANDGPRQGSKPTER